MLIECVRVIVISDVIVRCDFGLQFCAAAFGIIILVSFHASCLFFFLFSPSDLLRSNEECNYEKRLPTYRA